MADGAPISQMLVPQVRGALADPGAVEGRPSRVLLRVDGDQAGDAPVVRADMAAVAEALRGGAEAVSVPGIGTLTCTRPTPERALDGQVAVVTGGAGGLGFSVARALAAEGAALALFDIADGPVGEAADAVGGIGVACDVTDAGAVDAAMAQVVARYGGVDILISNAGSAHQGALLELDDAAFEKAFALNFWGHHYMARAAVRIMQAQCTGGALVFNVSKQAVNPGPNFAAYGTPKAALMALMRQYAVEHGADGITSNAVNADRIRTGLMTDAMVEARCKARGLTPDEYMRGNLVKREVTGADVAEAFLYLAKARTSTGAVITVDGGNVAAMMR